MKKEKIKMSRNRGVSLVQYSHTIQQCFEVNFIIFNQNTNIKQEINENTMKSVLSSVETQFNANSQSLGHLEALDFFGGGFLFTCFDQLDVDGRPAVQCIQEPRCPPSLWQHKAWKAITAGSKPQRERLNVQLKQNQNGLRVESDV
ncbi:hypothetical protein ILYODFUR_032829 [Ilyodon furcidens]|uniref:Uncharacterized protein n=1 Tax=Ilyodon furcidens TaxID=33524 RepID=A0ABV0UM29_9TELE